MPPKAADQKRKRGRPSNASKPTDASPGSPEAVETEEAPAPGRRGRPSKRKDAEVSPPAEEPKTKKRGRPPREAAVETEVEEANEEEPEPAQAKPKSKKANKSNSKGSEEAADENGSTSRGENAASRGKPGRKPRKEANEEVQDEEEAGASNAANRKRGRQPAKPTEEEEPREAVSPEPAPKKKRGRPSLDKKPAAEESSQAAEDAAPKKRGRKPKEKAPEVEEPAPEEEAEAATVPKRKRGRKANVTVEEVEEPPVEEEPTATKKRRVRPAAQAEPEAQEASQSELKEGRRRKAKQPVPAAETIAEKPTKKRRKKGEEEEEEEEEASPDTQRRRAGRPRTSDAASPQNETSQARKSKKRPTEDDVAEASAPAKKRRRRTSDEIQQEKQQQQQPKPEAPKTVRRAPKHRHIAARVRQVPRSVIEEKWSPLTNPSLSIISNLLRLAERPVLQRIPGSEKRRDQAASALHLITNRLVKKLSRGLPFPPASTPPTGGKNSSRKLLDTDGGRVEELNFERVIEGVAALERQLDPLLHAVDLLKTEKEREEKALEEDYDTLRTLEANARSEARNFKDSLRKTHVLVPEATKPGTASAAAENVLKHDEQDFNFIVSEEGAGSGTPLFKDLEDDELRGLAGQVGSHMESMRANLQQIDGVVPQIVKSRAALQDVLFKHLDQQSFENVLFG
ncbi:hypothetical protein CNYM01_11528 [Colletotrichum nymphaeae SA-01]|uniref:Kinetochore protein fta7 n=1 Tax=Colletotrichum nymphaeae SA-01 TaxID=1460502 RepID=A0A135SWB6_9PEZI|nr:hypothetical protein CNYM01_11528 [Colletotrichum nymphaeae SA-01]